MKNLDRIVEVQIALNTSGIDTQDFSSILVVGAHFHSLGRVGIYSSTSEMVEDGFRTDDPLYKAAEAIFSQTPHVPEVRIGRRQVDGISVRVGKVAPKGTYTIYIKTRDKEGTLKETPYAYTNNNGQIADILKGLGDVVTADAEAVVTALLSGDELIVASRNNTDFAFSVSKNLEATVSSATESIADTMEAVTADDGNFYGIGLASREEKDILAMAEWAEANEKLFATATAKDGAYQSDVNTDLGSKLKAKNFYRTYWFYHALPEEFPELALMSRCFTSYPGGETWALKKLAAITTDNLSSTKLKAICGDKNNSGKNGNAFVAFRNISCTQGGMVAAGEWIDVIRFRDWLKEEISVNVFNLLINREKVPYTDEGIAQVEARIRDALVLGQRRGGVATTEYDEEGRENLGFTVTVPLASSVSANTKAKRKLTDVFFTARLAGAIHFVEIKGSLTYENLIAG